MSAPVPLVVLGVLQDRLQMLVHPLADLELDFGDDDQLA
jgi:hypothetical protein